MIISDDGWEKAGTTCCDGATTETDATSNAQYATQTKSGKSQ